MEQTLVTVAVGKRLTLSVGGWTTSYFGASTPVQVYVPNEIVTRLYSQGIISSPSTPTIVAVPAGGVVL